MAETYIPFTLTTPLGSLTFNAVDGSSGYYLSDVQGMDGGATRHTEFALPQRDGAVVLDVLLGASYITLTGEIRITGTDSLTTRKTLMDTLLAYCDSIRKADGILTFTPTGDSDSRYRTVRLAEPIQIGSPGGVMKTFQLQMVAGNPHALATTQQTASIGVVASQGGSFVFPMVQNAGGAFPFTFGDPVAQTTAITPGGTTIAWPIITITGPVNAPVIRNLTTGFLVSFPNLALGDATNLVLDMWNETATIGSQSFIGYVDFSASDFWGLLPNTAQTIQLSGSNPTDTATAVVAWNNTYA